jgi:hypothetical protein
VLFGLKVTFFDLQLLQWLGYASLRLAMQTNCSSKKVSLLILITQYTILNPINSANLNQIFISKTKRLLLETFFVYEFYLSSLITGFLLAGYIGIFRPALGTRSVRRSVAQKLLLRKIEM